MKEAAEKLLNKKNTFYLMLLVTLGVATIFISNQLKTDTAETPSTSDSVLTTQNVSTNDDSYESELEKRMEAILSQIDGAGQTKVMITLSSGKEIVVGQDSDISTSSQEDGKNQTSTSSSKTVILDTGSGTDTPLIIKEIEPRVEGVVIVAEGGDNEKIKEKLTRAAQALLRIETYKVQIFKMK